MQSFQKLRVVMAAVIVLGATAVHAAAPAPKPETALPKPCDLIKSMLCDLQLAK